MSYYDDLIGGSVGPEGTGNSSYFDSIVGPPHPEAPEQPGWGTRALEGVGSVLGAPKRAIDWLAQQGAHTLGLPVGPEATTGSMLRAGLGLAPGQSGGQGYGTRLGGRAIEFAADVATDPVTWAFGGLGRTVTEGAQASRILAGAGPEMLPAIAEHLRTAAAAGARAAPVQKLAGGVFTGLMGVGAIQEGRRAIDDISREHGVTPQIAEEALGAGLQAAGAYAGAKHLLSERVTQAAEESRRAAPTSAEAPREAFQEEPAIAQAPPVWEGEVPQGFEPPVPQRTPQEVQLDLAEQRLREQAARADLERQTQGVAPGVGVRTPIPVVPEPQPAPEAPAPSVEAAAPPTPAPPPPALEPVQAAAPAAPEPTLEQLTAKAPPKQQVPLSDVSFLPEPVREPFMRDLKRAVTAYEGTDMDPEQAREAFAAGFPERYREAIKDKFAQMAYSRAQGREFLTQLAEDTQGQKPLRVEQDQKTGAPVEIYAPSGDPVRAGIFLTRDSAGNITAGAHASRGGIDAVVGGGRIMDLPDYENGSGAGPVYRAMKALGIQSSKSVTPAGYDTQVRAAARGLDVTGGLAEVVGDEQRAAAAAAGPVGQVPPGAGAEAPPAGAGPEAQPLREGAAGGRGAPGELGPEAAPEALAGVPAHLRPTAEALIQKYLSLARAGRTPRVATFDQTLRASGLGEHAAEIKAELARRRGPQPEAPTPPAPPAAAPPTIRQRVQALGRPIPRVVAPEAPAEAPGAPPAQPPEARLSVGPAEPQKPQEPAKLSVEPNALGFYSQLQRVAEKIPQTMRGSDLYRFLTDPKRGVRADEMKWTGLDDFLRSKADQKVTPQEVQEFLRANDVKVEEVRLESSSATQARLKEVEQRMDQMEAEYRRIGGTGKPSSETPEQAALAREIESLDIEREGLLQRKGEPKFSSYQLPGGTNYREVVLTLPLKPEPSARETLGLGKPTRVEIGDAGYEVFDENGKPWGVYSAESPEAALRVASERGPTDFAWEGRTRPQADRGFTKSHFSETPNVLAHIRLNDRTDAQGKKVLFVEEIQSDWAQKGRREGFKAETKPGELPQGWRLEQSGPAIGGMHEARVYDRAGRLVVSEAGETADAAKAGVEFKLQETLKNYPEYGGIPAAPFVTSTEGWTNLALKRVLRMAAEEGYDRVAWTPGAVQFKRWGSERFDWERVVGPPSFDGWVKKTYGLDPYELDVLPEEALMKYRREYNADKAELAKAGGWKVAASNQHGGEAGGIDIEGEARRRGLLAEARLVVRSRSELEDIVRLHLEHPSDAPKVVDRMWERMQREPTGTTMPRKEGMEGFYDKILPDAMNKLGKKWGARVGETRIPVPSGDKLSETGFRDWLRGAAEAQTEQGDVGAGYLLKRLSKADWMGQDATETLGRLRNESLKKYGVTDTSFSLVESMLRDRADSRVKNRESANVHSIDITPQMRESVVREGQPQFAPGEPGAPAPPDRAAVRAKLESLFKGQKVEEPGGPEGPFVVNTPSGKRVTVEPTGEISFNPEGTSAAKHGPGVEEGLRRGEMRVLGSMQTLGSDAWVKIVDAGQLPHEVGGHVFLDHFASEKERAFVEREWTKRAAAEGTGKSFDEAFADDYNRWFNDRASAPSTVLGNIFERIHAFFLRMASALGLQTRGGLFREIESGRPFQRTEGVARPVRPIPPGAMPGQALTVLEPGRPAAGRDPASMRPAEINKELDSLDKLTSANGDALIAAGRGTERFSESATKAKAGDALARERLDLSARQSALQDEITARYGPGAPSRLPTGRGFGPRTKLSVGPAPASPGQPPAPEGPPERPEAPRTSVTGFPKGSPEAAALEPESVGRPRVEAKVEMLRRMERLGELPPEARGPLSRDQPRTWKSLDPEVQKILRTTSEDALLRKAATGRLIDKEVMALDALRQDQVGRFKAAADALQRAQTLGEDTGPANRAVLANALKLAANQAAQGTRVRVEAATEIARALAAHARVMQAGNSIPDAFLRKLFREIPGVTDEQAGSLMTVLQTDPTKLPDALQKAMNPSLLNKWLYGWKNGLVSAVGTQVANIAGNVGEAGARLAETGVAAFVDRLLGGQRERFAGEAGAELRGAFSRLPSALSSLGENLKDIVKLAPEKIRLDRAFEHQVNPIGGKLGRAVGIPFRLLGAFDNFFKDIGGDSELGKLAYRKAAQELPSGTPAAEIRTRADQIVKEALDFNNPAHEDLLAKMETARQTRTFQGNPGQMTKDLMAMRSNSPWLHVLLPFIQTPANIMELTIERSPAGFLKAKRAYAAWKAAEAKGAEPALLSKLRGEAVDAIARPLMGTAVMGAFLGIAKQGYMTGSGPTDPKEKSLLRETGWQPYSFKVGDTYVPFNRFEPVSSMLGFAADLAEIKNEQKAGDIADKFLGSIVQNLTNKTYLASLADAAALYKDPLQFGSQYVQSLAGSAVPNIVAKAQQAYDPTVRDVSASLPGAAGFGEKVAKSVAARIPGIASTLPARLSATGEPVVRTGGDGVVGGAERFLLPVQPSQERPEANLEKTLVGLGVVPAQPSRDFTIPLSGGKKLRLTDEEYQTLQAANKIASDRARLLVENPRFQALDPEEQARQLRTLYDRARDYQRERLLQSREFRMKVREAQLQ